MTNSTPLVNNGRGRGRSYGLNRIKRALAYLVFGIDVTAANELPAYAPNSAGGRGIRTELTLLAANQVFPLLVLCQETFGKVAMQPISAESFCDGEPAQRSARQLETLFNQHGSDKSKLHNYHFVYGRILEKREKVSGVLEIGLGTNNADVISNMGAAGRPGASLRAFRDYLPAAAIFGADVDRRILFEEARIKTFFVDQTDIASFETLGRTIGTNLDLIIDDGLHSPNANLAVLIFALERLKPGGWLVIEDIAGDALPIWQLVASLLPPGFKPHIVAAKNGLIFAVEQTA